MKHRQRDQNPAFDPFGMRTRKVEGGSRHACAIPGCPNRGEFRAPRDRTLSDYMWLCLAHVQEFNRNWNYYEGMTAEQIEAELQKDTIWQRPTWKLGQRAGGRTQRVNLEDLEDSFGLFDDEREAAGQYQQRQHHRAAGADAEMAEEAMRAMRELGVTPPLSKASLRARYMDLVKKYHPDATGGDKDAEERFKKISAAYRVLTDSLRRLEGHAEAG